MKKAENQILVIFGASGDLTHRKLLPALFELYSRDLLPEKFQVIGAAELLKVLTNLGISNKHLFLKF